MLNRTFFRTQLIKSSNQSFKTDMARFVLFLVFNSCRSTSILKLKTQKKKKIKAIHSFARLAPHLRVTV